MIDTTFVACNALTNTVIAELPLVNAHYTRVLNDSGVLEGEIEMDAAAALGLGVNGAIEPAAVSIYVNRGGAYVWGGFLWSYDFEGATSKLSLHAAEFGSLLALKAVFSQSLTLTNVDPAVWACSWAQAAFAAAGAPLTALYTPTTTQFSITINPWEAHIVLDLMRAATTIQGGIDWTFVVDPTGPRAQYESSFPRRGVSYVHSGIVWDFPGPVLNYKATKDGTRIAGTVIESGAGSGSQTLEAIVGQSPQGHLSLDYVESNPNLTDQPTTQAFALGRLVTMTTPPILTSLTINGDAFFGSGVDVGDEVVLAAADAGPLGSLPGRIIGYDVKVQTTSAVEQVDVTLGAVL